MRASPVSRRLRLALCLAAWLAPSPALASDACTDPAVPCVAGVAVDCPKDTRAGAGTVTCRVRVPAKASKVVSLVVEVAAGGKPTVIDAGRGSGDAAMWETEIKLPVPEPGDLSEPMERLVTLRWSADGVDHSGRTSLARLIHLPDLVLLPPPSILPGAPTALVLRGQDAPNLEGGRLKCILAEVARNEDETISEAEEARLPDPRVTESAGGPLVIDVPVPDGARGPGRYVPTRVVPMEVPEPVFGTDRVFDCKLTGRVRGWKLSLAFGLNVATGLTDPAIWPAQSLARLGDRVRVMVARPKPTHAAIEPVADTIITTRWTEKGLRREATVVPSATGLWYYDADVPKTVNESSSLFHYELRGGVERLKLTGLAVEQVLPSLAPATVRLEVSPPIITVDQPLAISGLARRFDGWPIRDTGELTVVTYAPGAGWNTAGIALKQRIVHAEPYETTVTFQSELLLDDRIGPVARLIVVSYVKLEGNIGVADYRTALLAPRPLTGLVMPGAGLYDGFAPTDHAAVVTWADGRPLADAEIVLQRESGGHLTCQRVDDVLWRCADDGKGTPRGALRPAARLADPTAADGLLESADVRPAPPDPVPGTLRITQPILTRGTPLSVRVASTETARPARGAQGTGGGPAATAAPTDALPERCDYPVLVTAWRVGRAPAMVESCADAGGPPRVATIPDTTDLPGALDVVALWSRPGKVPVETWADAMVLPAGGLDPVDVSIAEDRSASVRLKGAAAEADWSLVWLTDRMDLEGWTLRADNVAAAAMGVRAATGHTIWSSQIDTPAGLLARAISGEVDPQGLRVGVRDGHDQLTPQWKMLSISAGAHLETAEEARTNDDLSAALASLGAEWKKMESEVERIGRCPSLEMALSFQIEAAASLHASRGGLDASIWPRMEVVGPTGLNVHWLGPDGVHGTTDDRWTAVVVRCGFPDSGWTEPRIELSRPVPPAIQYEYRPSRMVRTHANRSWLDEGRQAGRKEWKSGPLHGGRWWLHAVGFKAGALHYAAIRELDVPFPIVKGRPAIHERPPVERPPAPGESPRGLSGDTEPTTPVERPGLTVPQP